MKNAVPPAYKGKKPMLIVDKHGMIGTVLAKKLLVTTPVVFVGKAPSFSHDVLVSVPFVKAIPTIPGYQYQLFVIVYSEDIAMFFDALLARAREDGTSSVIILPYHLCTQQIVQKIHEENSEARILIVGDVFGQDVITHPSHMHTLLIQAKVYKQMHIAGHGLTRIFPVHISDVVLAIEHVAASAPAWYASMPAHPMTILSFAGMVQKSDPLLKLDFMEGEDESLPVTLPSPLVYLPLSPLQKHIEETLGDISSDAAIYTVQDVQPPARSSTKNPYVSALVLFVIFFFLLSPTLSLLLGLVGIQQLHAAKKDAEKGNFVATKARALTAGYAFSLSLQAMELLTMQLRFIGQQAYAEKIVSTLTVGRDASGVVSTGVDAVEKLMMVLEGKSTRPTEDVTSAVVALKQALITGQKLRTQSLPFLLRLEDVLSHEHDELLQKATSVIDTIPHILGTSGKRNYLVLFQNNMELRPTGGFIGSFGLLRLDHGTMHDLTIYDVYDADGKLKGHIEPPFPIRRYLEVPHLYLRDSNYSLDYPKNASMAAFLLNEELGEVVDGVIAVDVTAIRAMLQAIGPVYVPDYGQTVNAENMYMTTQKHAEKDFFPGSTQKKDFLHSLFTALKLKLKEDDKLPYTALAKAAGEAMLQKHLFFAFADASVQTPFTINGLAASMWDDRGEQAGTVHDTLGVNEANVGINKANYFMKRKIEQHVTMQEDGTVNEKVTIRYKNESTSWPGGDYRAYLRIILPKEAVIDTITLDGVIQTIVPAITDFTTYEQKGFVAPQGLEIERTEEFGKTIYGFFLTVPQQQYLTVTLSYTIQKVLPDTSLTYTHRVIKQPGTDNDPFVFSLSVPQNKTIKTEAQVTQKEGGVEVVTSLQKDLRFLIQILNK